MKINNFFLKTSVITLAIFGVDNYGLCLDQQTDTPRISSVNVNGNTEQPPKELKEAGQLLKLTTQIAHVQRFLHDYAPHFEIAKIMHKADPAHNDSAHYADYDDVLSSFSELYAGISTLYKNVLKKVITVRDWKRTPLEDATPRQIAADIIKMSTALTGSGMHFIEKPPANSIEELKATKYCYKSYDNMLVQAIKMGLADRMSNYIWEKITPAWDATKTATTDALKQLLTISRSRSEKAEREMEKIIDRFNKEKEIVEKTYKIDISKNAWTSFSLGKNFRATLYNKGIDLLQKPSPAPLYQAQKSAYATIDKPIECFPHATHDAFKVMEINKLVDKDTLESLKECAKQFCADGAPALYHSFIKYLVVAITEIYSYSKISDFSIPLVKELITKNGNIMPDEAYEDVDVICKKIEASKAKFDEITAPQKIKNDSEGPQIGIKENKEFRRGEAEVRG